MAVIEVENLTKDYGHGRGVYDVSLAVEKGETLGFLGPNGAGKSTTMRHLMGFSMPQRGTVKIDGMDCRKAHDKILRKVGYLPGEVSLPDGLTGQSFLDMMCRLRKSIGKNRLDELVKLFPVDLNTKVTRMSIGEKRKLAVIATFMNDPDIYLLDEPTSGLDPVMQEVFIDFVLEEKKRGKTILLSSHIFSEVEALCDRIEIIKDGRIVSVVKSSDVKHGLRKKADIAFVTKADFEKFKNENFEFVNCDADTNKATIVIEDGTTNKFLAVMKNYNIKAYEEYPSSLEAYFMHFYKNDRTFGGVTNG